MTSRTNRSLRIATVCFSPQTGGLEFAPLRRAAELRAAGHHAIAIIPEAPALAEHAERLGLPVETIDPSLSYLDPMAALRMRSIFRRERIDIAIVARTRDLSTTMLAAGGEVAVVLYQQMQSGLNKRDWFHNRVFRRLDGCVTITNKGRDELIRCTVLPEERIAVIPYGLDTTRFAADAIERADARRQFDLPEDGFVVGVVGGFDPAKGQKEFLEGLAIAAELDSELGARLHGLLVGKRPTDNPDYVAELTALRDSLPFADRVRFHPFSLDPRPAYRALDIFVLSSHCETFGMVLQEALAMGVPSIATDAGGVTEIVTHGENGLLVPPHDPRAIAEAIVTLYRDPALRDRLVERARTLVLERYDEARQYQAFEQELARAVERRRGRP